MDAFKMNESEVSASHNDMGAKSIELNDKVEPHPSVQLDAKCKEPKDSNKIPSSVQSDNDLCSKHNKSNGIGKPTHMLNGVQSAHHNQHFHPSKTMHLITPGPIKYQNIKKSPDKEPKFVPYEPYKAAVRSIVPELSQPSVAVFRRKLSTSSTCSKVSNTIEDNKEDMITTLSQEKQVKYLLLKC